MRRFVTTASVVLVVVAVIQTKVPSKVLAYGDRVATHRIVVLVNLRSLLPFPTIVSFNVIDPSSS